MKKQTIFSALITICFMLIFPITAQAAEVWDGSVDIDWYNSTDTSFTITTAEQLAGLAQLVNDHEAVLTDDFEGKTITLASDIDLGGSATPWTPIAYGDSSNVVFRGVFDGAGYKITGLYIGTTDEYNSYPVGFFGKSSSESTIKNLSVDGSVTGLGYNDGAGGVVGLAYGRVVGCSSSATVTATGDNGHAGGIVGLANGSGNYIINCYNTGDISATGQNGSAGGIVGRTNNALAITNCYNSGSVSATNAISNVGGIVGYNSVSTATITNCYNIGELDGAGDVGGVVGDNTGVVKNSYYLTDKGATIGVGLNSGTAGNVGSFTSADSEITIEGTADNSISTDSLLTALNEGARAYNDTVNPVVIAYEWKIDSSQNKGYPVFVTNWKNFASETAPKDDKITNASELAWLINNPNVGGNYILTQDIDLSKHMWTPIGNKNNNSAFNGIFDGAYYKITGMNINAPTAEYQGLFGITASTSTIKNVSVSGTVTGYNYVGGVVGHAFGSVVGCSSSATVIATGEDGHAGGVVGYATTNGNYITNCYNTGDVSTTGTGGNAGGIAGATDAEVAITNCYNSGSVSATDATSNVGGIVGYNSVSTATITNCYNIGELDGAGGVGGVVGDNTGVVTNSYYLTDKGATTGIGSNSGTAKNVGSFSGIDSEITIDGGVTPDGTIPTTNLYDALSAGTIAYNDTANPVVIAYEWNVDSSQNKGYPVFVTRWKDFASETAPKDGKITNANELAWLINNPTAGGNYILTQDIDLSRHMWTPIGSINNYQSFHGVFDGAHYKITGMYINAPTGSYQGLFGETDSNSTIKNVSVSGTVTGYNYVGGVVGYNGGSVINCTSSVTVTGNTSVGGTVGYSTGSITNSSNSGTVTGNNNVGGILGRAIVDSTLQNSYNTGNVSSTNGYCSIGGVVGYSTTPITNCYNTGTISAMGNNSYVGGIAGDSNKNMTNCYSAGTISATGNNSYVGGLIGIDTSNAIITHSYYQSDKGVSTSIGYHSTPLAHVGSFTSVDSEITIEGIADNSISTTDLLTALNQGTAAYNATDPEIDALGWVTKKDVNNNYPMLETYWTDYAVEPKNGLITSAEELAWLINNYTAGTYTLTKDIDLSAHMWKPIGYNDKPFYGTFDGAEHKITGLSIYAPTTDHQGLFGFLGSGGMVKNVGVHGDIRGYNHVGGVVAENWGSVSNCYNSTNIHSEYTFSNIGGVVGENVNGVVIDCYNNGDISVVGDSANIGGVVGSSGGNSWIANNYNTGNISGTGKNARAGGIIGNFEQGTISNSYNTGNILLVGSAAYCGGVVGENGGSVIDSHNTGMVTADCFAGGVVGRNTGTIANSYNTGTVETSYNEVVDYSSTGGVSGTNSAGNIINCYNSGNVITFGIDAKIGGMVGYNYSGTVTNSYSIGDISVTDKVAYVGGVVGSVDIAESSITNCYYLTDKDVLKGAGALFRGTYTHIGSFSSPDSVITIDDGVTSTDSISKINLVTALNAGVDAYNTANPDAEQAKMWMPKTGQNEGYPVYATYWSDNAATTAPTDGKITSAEELAWLIDNHDDGAYTLTKTIDLSEHMWTPIGYVDDIHFSGTFDGGGNKITGLYINAPTSVQLGLFGRINGGTVKNVGVDGVVIGKDYVGGVAGYVNNSTTVENCYISGAVSATGDSAAVGGMVGYVGYSTVANCYNSGAVLAEGANSNVGGVVGYGNRSTVTNSYNTGAVSAEGADSDVGGVVGENYIFSTVTNSYNTGDVSATGELSNAGGVVGYNYNNAVTNSYYKKGTSLKAIGYIRSGTVKNVGSFESPTSVITIEGEADSNISTDDLLTALIAGAKAYNETAPDGLKAYRWEMVSQDSYPTLTTERKFGDTNGDWEIDKDDLTAIAGESYNTVATPETDNLDVNGDGVINFIDLAVVRNSKYFEK